MRLTPLPNCRIGAAVQAFILAMLLAVPWQAATAAPVSSKQAATAVAGWLSLDPMPLGEALGSSVLRVDTFSDKTGSVLYYVVYLDPSGYVLVAGDDLVEPIVGFAPAGKFDPATSNPLGALASNDLSVRVAYVRQVPAAALASSALQAQAKWQRLMSQETGPPPQGPTSQGLASVSDVRVAPLTQSTWDQGTAAAANTTACYNYYTPPYGDGNKNNYWAGCVATAMAQLMRYYQFPTTGVGSAGFTIYSDGSPLTYYLHGGTGPGGAYVWGNMPLVPPATPTTTQCQAIGALVADAGATVSMNYAASGSAASLADAKTAMTATFHYSRSVIGYNGSSNIGAGLTGMINPNLDAGYPVILGITGSQGGHAVVADGYGYSESTLYHHLNLGWSGTATAWYSLPIIDAGSYYFNVVHSCLYNTYTNGSGEIISGRVVDQIGRPVVNATVSASRTGGGNYATTTDSRGIYALTHVPANSTYSITVTKTDYSPANRSASTGTSSDFAATSGNLWGADLTMNMLTTVLDHLAWGTVAATQSLSVPFGVTVNAQNLTNGPATGFAGPVALSAYMTGVGSSSSTVIGNLGWSNARSSSGGLTDGYDITPSTNLQVTAVRAYSDSGIKVSIWTASGALLASQTTVSSGAWGEATLATPIILSAGATYRITGYSGPNVWSYRQASWPTTFANGVIGQTYYTASGDNFPMQVFANNQGPLVDLRYKIFFSNSVPVSPTSSGAFASGVWNGNVTVGGMATNVVLKADDGAGHTAISTPFNVIDPSAAPPVIVTHPQSRTNNAGDNATFSVVATSSQTPAYYWRRNGSFISGGTASSYTLNNVQLADSGSLFSCVVSNSYGSVTSHTATLTVTCTNVVVASQPSVTLNAGSVIYAVAPLSDGSLIFGGYFTNVNGVARSRLARLLPNGALDMTWNPGANSSVFALAVSGTDLYVGGAFSIIGSYSRNFIAKLSTTATGAVDPTWNPNANDWVEALVPNGTELYVGGYFTSIGAQNRNCIAKLSTTGTGAADTTWNPSATISGDYPAVFALAVSGVSVYAGGYFTGIGGQTRYGLAKLSATGAGAADATWNPSANSTLYALAANASSVYAAGAFTTIGSQSRNYIAKLSSTGTGLADPAWNPNTGSGSTNGIWSLALRGQSIYAGGAFSTIGGLNRTNLAKLSALGVGAADPAWEADCDGEVDAVVPGATALYVGGGFSKVAGQSRPGVAALTFTPLQLLSPQRPGGAQFQCTVSGERGQAYEILASTNPANPSGWGLLTSLTNTTGTVQFTDSAASPVRRFYRAHQLP